jgi:RNA polymerase sigma factor (sigma-70 family)
VEVERDEELDFDALYALTGPRLWRAILAYTGGRRELTDDVVAEAFTRTLEQGRGVRQPVSYLYRVAFRLAAAELRRPTSNSPLPEGELWDDPGLTELFDVFEHLSAGQRAAVYLRFQADLPIKEVAELMGTSPGAARIHLFRARRTLAKLLGHDDD